MGKYRTNLHLKLVKKRTTFGWIFFILVVILGKGSVKHILIGLPFIILGELIRSLSAGIIRKNEILATDGTYKLCRHPLYFGSFLISTGFVIASNSIFILLYFLIFFPLFYIPAIKREEDYLIQKFGHEYLNYRKTAPVFLPILKKTDLKNISLSQMLKNGEHINWVIIAFVLFFLLIKAYNIFCIQS